MGDKQAQLERLEKRFHQLETDCDKSLVQEKAMARRGTQIASRLGHYLSVAAELIKTDDSVQRLGDLSLDDLDRLERILNGDEDELAMQQQTGEG